MNTINPIIREREDTFNYMARESKKGVADVSEAFFQGRARVAKPSIAERIEKLNALKQSGAISREELEMQKNRILNKMVRRPLTGLIL